MLAMLTKIFPQEAQIYANETIITAIYDMWQPMMTSAMKLKNNYWFVVMIVIRTYNSFLSPMTIKGTTEFNSRDGVCSECYYYVQME